jgi:diguanylate cyclase (GGDEF)-like protein
MEPTALRNTAPPERATLFFAYLGAVCALAIVVLTVRIPLIPQEVGHATAAFWALALLAVASDAGPVNTPGRRQATAIFTSICFTFSILLAWGFGPAALVQVAAVVVSSLRMRHTVWRAAFNAGQYTLSFAAAAGVLAMGARPPLALGAEATLTDVLLVVLAALVWFAVNYVLVTTALWLRFSGRWTRLFVGTLGYEALAAGALLLLAPFLVVAAHTSVWLIPLISVPLYAVHQMARLSREQARQARLDSLTGLANRKALRDAVAEQVLAHAERAADGATDRRFALLLLDLDRFKHVNDTLGHGMGDRVLVEVARRLTAAVSERHLVVRLGGDEFAILATRIPDAAAARALAARVTAALTEPVEIDGLPLDVGASTGIALYPEHGDDFAELMSHADVAMYDAKTRSDAVAVYAPESDHNTPERLSLLGDLRKALERVGDPEITVYYQPQVALDTGEVVGVEALLRWNHPQTGMVDPEELIRVAEHSGVMRLLTLRIVDDVVAQLARWKAGGLVLRASINVSVRDLHTGEIVDRLARGMRERGISADQIQVEITEGALMADPRRVLAILQKLDRIGVALSLDDFGTGYSSMQHLRRLPLSEVKIDRSFVAGMATDPDDEAIVRSIIGLARALGMRVVAEGVENERTRRQLVDAGCHVGQGWHYARPMPGSDLPSWIARYERPLALLREVPAVRPAAG